MPRTAILVPVAVLCLALQGYAQGQQPRTAAETWNDEYRGKAERGFTFTPNRFLASFTEKLKPGTALDIAMGQGRNALMLAGRGWDVTGFDISDVAVAQAEAQAKARRVKFTLSLPTAAPSTSE